MTLDLAEAPDVVQAVPEESIRVLFVSHDSSMFGAQRVLLTLLSSIDRRAFTPMLLLPSDGPMASQAAALGIPVFFERLVHWVPGSAVSTGRQRVRYLARFLRSLLSRCRAISRLITEHKVDLVYSNTVTCIEGAIAAQRTRKPHVWHIHEHILQNSDLTPLFPYRFYCAAIRFLASSVIFCSKGLASSYPLLSEKAFIVYNGLPFPPLREKFSSHAELLRGLGCEVDTKVVAVVGSLFPRKDHMTFLAAAEKVARTVKNPVFLIVGSGYESYTNRIRIRIRELQLDSRVRLLGWRDDVYNLLAGVDVLVISSEQESFGLTAIEALSMETPVVSTRCGGPEEIMVDGETGLLVPVKDPDAMADAIVKLLKNPELARGMGIRGRAHVSTQFGIDRFVRCIQGVIKETAACRA
jgi:glycosyltransferase involved in cell wall biosynthesis